MSQHYNSFRERVRVRRLSGYITVLAALFLTLVVPGVFAQTHVANPYVGATVYVSQDYANEVGTAIAAQPSGSTLAGQMATVAKQPTFIWLDRIAAIAGGSVNGGRGGLQDQINAAVAQSNGGEIVVQLVIYDLPDRDCAALASNGELSIAGNDTPKGYTTALTGTGIQEYENDYILPIYNILAAAPSNVRFVLVLEDDSLPNILTNTGVSFTDANCVAANDGISNAGAAANWTQTATPALNISPNGVYYQGITFAANTFHKLPNAYSYLDLGHHGWLGWTSNTAYAVDFFSSFVQQMSAGYSTIDGFITNTANYGPLKEPFIVWDEVAGGPETNTNLTSGIFTGDFYQWDPAIDELSFVNFFTQALTASSTAGYTDPRGQAHTPGGGFPSTIGFLIDTSRNGWGNTSAANGAGSSAYQVRPTAAGTSTVIDTFVNESKIDLRNSSGQWCNQENAGIGELPVANPTSGVSAYVWVKPPGEADGNYPGSVYNGVTATDGDPNCNPITANPQAGADTIANSIPNSPPAGTFWLTEFVQLVQDAYPVLATSTPTEGFTLTPASSAVTLAQGASTTDVITVTDIGGFTGVPTLTATSSNTGVTVTVSGDTLTIAASSTATGTATISVTGTSGSTTANASITVTVAAAGFTLTPASSAVTLAQGASTTDAITVTDTGGFTGIPTLSATSSNTGVTVTVSGDTLTIAASSTATGTATIAVTGTSGTTTANTSITVTVTAVGFSLTPASSAVTIAPGASTTDAITVTDTGGFTGAVTLTATSSNTGVTVTVSGTTLTIAASSTATGTATIAVTGTSGTKTATTSITVTVSGGTGACQVVYTISPQSSTAFGAALTIENTSTTALTSWTLTWSFANGQTISSLWNGIETQSGANVTVKNEPYNGSIPAGGSATGIGFNGTLNGSGNAVPTNFAINGTACGGTPVQGFSITPSATALSILQGASGTDAITVADTGGFTGSVAFVATGMPTGVTASFSPTSSATSSVVTFAVASTTVAGTYPITITGTSGTLTPATTTITLTVTPQTGGFTLKPSATTLTVAPGASGADTITVTDIVPFTGIVAFAATGMPTGVTAAFSPTSSATSSVLTLTVASSTVAGNYTITVTGTSGSLAAVTTSFTLTVTGTGGYTLKPSAATLTVAPGASGTDTITVTDISPFTGTVAFAASGMPTGVTAAFSPTSSTTSSVLTLTVASTTAVGNYTITVTGTSGTLAAVTTSFTLTVATASSCTVDYTISPQNSSAFGAALTIVNNGTALSSWTLTWTFANGQTVSSLWNGIETQSGAVVTVKNEPYNGSIPAGGTLSGMGFNGTWNGTTNAIPTAISLNGTACTVN